MGITMHLKQRKRLDTQLLNFVLYTQKNGTMKISPIIVSDNSPMDYVQRTIDSLQPSMYLICAEAWAVIPEDKEKFMKNYEYGDIEKEPTKYETMVFIAKTLDGKESHNEWYKIIRDDKRKIIDYKKQKIETLETTKLT
jgi:hypothetical protein